jgi:D-alanyl-D-alanine carboxypeptidase
MEIKSLKIFALIVIILFTTNAYAKMNIQNNLSEQQLDTIKKDLQKVIARTQQQFNLIGLSVAVLLPNQQAPLTLTTGKTLIDDGNPLTSSSLFQVGSTTKTFTAVVVAKAIHDKYLSLDDKLGAFFPEYVLWKNITIGELLNNTSGIFDYIDSKDWWHKLSLSRNKIWSAKSLVDIAYQYPVKFPAGTKWAYSNTNYVLLGLVLEKVTHKSMDDLMSGLMQDADLRNTYYVPKKYPISIAQRMVHGYGFYDATYDMTTQNGSIWHAAGAIISSPEDLAYWMRSLFTTNPININWASVSHYLRLKNTRNGKDVTEVNQAGYSFGLFRMNTPEGVIWFTPGLTSGYITGMVYAPCIDLYFAYSTNKAPVRGLHEFIIMNMLHAMNSNKDYQKFVRTHANSQRPSYCSKVKLAAKFIFPL